jgi:hypothetical protein
VEYHGHLYKPLKKALPKDAKSTTAVSLDFLAQYDPEGFRSEIRSCLLPWTRTLAHTIRLKPLQYALSYCQKHSIDMNHEQLYCNIYSSVMLDGYHIAKRAVLRKIADLIKQ